MTRREKSYEPLPLPVWLPFSIDRLPPDVRASLPLPGDRAMTRQPEAGMPVGALLASALMAANIPCDSGEDVDRLIAEMAKHGVRLIRHGSIEAAVEGHFSTGRHGTSIYACGLAVAMDAAALSDSEEPSWAP